VFVSFALARTFARHALEDRDMVFNGIRLSCAGGRAITWFSHSRQLTVVFPR